MVFPHSVGSSTLPLRAYRVRRRVMVVGRVHPLGYGQGVSSSVVDDYLAGVPSLHRETLNVVRARIHAALPTAEECIKYGVPAFTVDGASVAGFAAYTRHCSYFPMSGGVLGQLGDALSGYATSKGTLKFAPDSPLPADLVNLLVRTRLDEIAERGR